MEGMKGMGVWSRAGSGFDDQCQRLSESEHRKHAEPSFPQTNPHPFHPFYPFYPFYPCESQCPNIPFIPSIPVKIRIEVRGSTSAACVSGIWLLLFRNKAYRFSHEIYREHQ